MTHNVKAQAFNRKTGRPTAPARWEEINIQRNHLFKGCKTILDIKNAYESFWNNLNPKSTDIVFVQEIKTL